MSYTTDRFAIRTVKGGAVIIGGKVFRPREWYQERDGCLRRSANRLYNDVPYRGELDGMRLVFGRYRDHSEDGFAEFVQLWGSVRNFTHHDDWPGPNCIDGVFQWDSWCTEEKWQKLKKMYLEYTDVEAD